MDKNMRIIIYLIALVATVVAVDLLFFKQRFWERLLANVGIILLYIAFYSRFFK